VVDKEEKKILFLDDSLIIRNAFNNFLNLYSLTINLRIKRSNYYLNERFYFIIKLVSNQTRCSTIICYDRLVILLFGAM
jgi:hypothetical protein